MKIKRIIRSLIILIMAAGLCLGVSVIREGHQMYQEAIASVSLEDKVAEIRDIENYTTYDELPGIYVDAVVAVEDKRFFNHPGFDVLATGRAVINDIQAGAFVEGGSTITQQLAKNMYFSQKKELTRKVAEVFVAFDLERNYSKEEIMELYVNTIYFGDGNYSVQEASENFFGKHPQDMTDYESTLLAGVPNAPSKYAPTISLELAQKRQEQVVRRMVACGYFSDQQAEETLAYAEGV